MLMPEVKLRVWKCRDTAELPHYASAQAAGADLASAVDLVIEPGHRALVPTGICLALPPGYEGQVRPRSGLAAKKGVTVLNAPGTIDSDYRGEVQVILCNFGAEAVKISVGDRIAQLVVAPVSAAVIIQVSEQQQLGDTERGAKGFGSTGGFAKDS